MTDHYEKIRKALEMGPTPGPWGFTELPRDMQRDGYKFAISRRGIGWRFAQIAHEMKSIANATYITACDPDTIRALLAERDALAAEVERLAMALRRYGVRDQACSAMDIPICTCGLDAALEQEDSND